MQEIKYSELIAKQLKGEATPEEHMLIDDWINESQEHKEIARQFEIVWNKTKINYSAKNSDQVFDKIMLKINQENQRNRYVSQAAEHTNRWRTFSYGTAAAMVIIVAATILIFSHKENRSATPLPEASQISKALPKGQKMKIFLPDGSVVWLNAESEITYPDRFDESNRLVALKGEAYFDVASDATKPFIVQTHGLEVVVLGTTFNVRSYLDEKTTEVALESGKVLINLNSQNLGKYILTPGEGMEYDASDDSIKQFEVDHKTAFSWKDGVIYFNDASFNEVISRLSRWYGVEFTVENYHRQKWVYSGEFKDENLNNILLAMSFTKGFEYQIDQNMVYINFN